MGLRILHANQVRPLHQMRRERLQVNKVLLIDDLAVTPSLVAAMNEVNDAPMVIVNTDSDEKEIEAQLLKETRKHLYHPRLDVTALAALTAMTMGIGMPTLPLLGRVSDLTLGRESSPALESANRKLAEAAGQAAKDRVAKAEAKRLRKQKL